MSIQGETESIRRILQSFWVNMVKKAESVGDYGFPLSASPSGALQTEKSPRGETLEFQGNMRRRLVAERPKYVRPFRAVFHLVPRILPW